jgi:hypothetical protein
VRDLSSGDVQMRATRVLASPLALPDTGTLGQALIHESNWSLRPWGARAKPGPSQSHGVEWRHPEFWGER